MSAKQQADKQKPNFPWTARQRRGVKQRRLARKQLRRITRNLR